nr:MAK10-like protein [Tanacetum cinerariifolium]
MVHLVAGVHGHKIFGLGAKARLPLTRPTQMNKITSSCEICSGPHYTQYCMKNPEQAFVDHASSRIDGTRSRTMDMTIDQQVAMDEALVSHARRLRIGRSNFCLLSNITFKESTLQLVYDVLRLTPFFKAFLVIADVPEIYMQEFWATTIVNHHSIRFKMDNKKHIINLESFREMLHICPRLPHQPFVEPPFEEEILAFL